MRLNGGRRRGEAAGKARGAMAKADPFEVWGTPPQALTRGMSPRQLSALRGYTKAVTGRCYRIAFDNGISHAFDIVGTTVQREWKRQQRKHRR